MNEWDSFNNFDQRSLFESFIHEMPLLFKIFALLFIAFFAFIIIKMLKVWLSNNASPLISASCTAVTKRSEVWGGSGDTSASTSYYVTFQFDDGSRIEFQVMNRDFGLIVEGDRGEILYQGTRFKEFKRLA